MVIIDYKSSDVTEQKAADQRARESLQLRIYALAVSARRRGICPRAVELRFLESGLAGRHRPTEARIWSRRRRGDRGRGRGHPRATLRGDALLPGLPLLPVQPDLPEHRDPGVRKGNP